MLTEAEWAAARAAAGLGGVPDPAGPPSAILEQQQQPRQHVEQQQQPRQHVEQQQQPRQHVEQQQQPCQHVEQQQQPRQHVEQQQQQQAHSQTRSQVLSSQFGGSRLSIDHAGSDDQSCGSRQNEPSRALGVRSSAAAAAAGELEELRKHVAALQVRRSDLQEVSDGLLLPLCLLVLQGLACSSTASSSF